MRVPDWIFGDVRPVLQRLGAEKRRIIIEWAEAISDKRLREDNVYLKKLCKEQQAHIKNLEAELLPHLVDTPDEVEQPSLI